MAGSVGLDQDRMLLTKKICDETYSWIYNNLPFAADTQLPIKEARALRGFVNLLENESRMYAELISLVGDEDDDHIAEQLKEEARESFLLAEGYFCQLY